MVVEGTLIANRYRVDAVLGESDLGVLVRARHVMLDDAVIVKILADDVVDKRLTAKFIREARNAARIKSDHVARFVDVGTLDDGRPFVVMENLEGRSLDRVIADGEAISESDAVDWMLEVAEALAAAHALGIVHRQLRASSVFLATTPTGHRSVKVMHFGSSRIADSSGREEDPGLTVAGLRDGSPDYAAPETFIRSAVDGRADIWSIGVILFEALGRIRPFGGAPEDVVRRILAEPPPSLVALRPLVSPGLVDVIQKCIAKRPEERYADVAALAVALAPFASPAGKVQAKRVAGHATITIPAPALPKLAEVTSEMEISEASLHKRVPGGVQRVTYEGMVGRGASKAPPPQRTSSRAVPIAISTALVLGILALWVGRQVRADRAAKSAPAPTVAVSAPTPSVTASEEPPPLEAATASATSAEPSTSVVASAPPPRARGQKPARRAPPDALAPVAAPVTTTPPSRAAVDDPWGWKR